MKVITIGKRLVPVEQVAFVEPFDPAANPEFKPEKDFKVRVPDDRDHQFQAIVIAHSRAS